MTNRKTTAKSARKPRKPLSRKPVKVTWTAPNRGYKFYCKDKVYIKNDPSLIYTVLLMSRPVNPRMTFRYLLYRKAKNGTTIYTDWIAESKIVLVKEATLRTIWQ